MSNVKWAKRHREISNFIQCKGIVEAEELQEKARQILREDKKKRNDGEEVEITDQYIKKQLKQMRDVLEKQCGLTLRSVQKTRKVQVGKKRKGKRKKKASTNQTEKVTYFTICAQSQDEVNQQYGSYFNEPERYFLKALVPLIFESSEEEGFSKATALSKREDMPDELRRKMGDKLAFEFLEKLISENILEEKGAHLFPGLLFDLAFDTDAVQESAVDVSGDSDYEDDDLDLDDDDDSAE